MSCFCSLPLLATAMADSADGGQALHGDFTDHTLRKRSDDPVPLESLVQQQAASIQALQAEVNALKADFVHVKTSISAAVAFSAEFTHDPVTNVGVGSTIIFDRVKTNLGGAYNGLTGIFTATAPGLYVFFVQLMGSDDQGSIDLSIVKQSAGASGLETLDFVWAEGTADIHDQSSCLTTVHLEVGAQVWVRHRGGSSDFRGSGLTTFSGFLVHADL